MGAFLDRLRAMREELDDLVPTPPAHRLGEFIRTGEAPVQPAEPARTEADILADLKRCPRQQHAALLAELKALRGEE